MAMAMALLAVNDNFFSTKTKNLLNKTINLWRCFCLVYLTYLPDCTPLIFLNINFFVFWYSYPPWFSHHQLNDDMNIMYIFVLDIFVCCTYHFFSSIMKMFFCFALCVKRIWLCENPLFLLLTRKKTIIFEWLWMLIWILGNCTRKNNNNNRKTSSDEFSHIQKSYYNY